MINYITLNYKNYASPYISLIFVSHFSGDFIMLQAGKRKGKEICKIVSSTGKRELILTITTYGHITKIADTPYKINMLS